MLPAPFEYHAPNTMDEALGLLDELGEDAKVLAGGQSLIPLLKLRFASPAHLVDINKIKDLDFLEERDGMLRVGPLFRHKSAERSSLLASRYQVMADAAPQIADPIIRNRGTVAVAVHLQMEDGKVGSAGIGLTAVGPQNIKAGQAEAALRGASLDDTTIKEAAALAAEAAEPTADQRGSVEYKRNVVRVFTER